MACSSPDCAYIYNDTIKPPALQANPDISGIGVLVGFVGTAYTVFLMLVLRYIMGSPTDTSLSCNALPNPIDRNLLSFIWRMIGKPPEHWGPALRSMVLTLSDTQIVTGLSILASGYSQINSGLSIFHWHTIVFLAWFSSTTHLTTLTFLRNYIQKNDRIRFLRLVLMLFLACSLAVALVPTGGACGMLGAGQAYVPSKTSISPYAEFAVYPGAPVKCCFELSFKGSFIINRKYFYTMLSSELVLISSSIARVMKTFRSCSMFAKKWLRHKPSRLCKYCVARVEARFHRSNGKTMQCLYSILHCSGITLIIIARGFFDLMESNIWEISWLLFSLAWGTATIFEIRGYAGIDWAAPAGSQGQVILEENFWGFGQWTPTFLLILPLLSFAECYLDMSSDSFNATSDALRLKHDLPPTYGKTVVVTLRNSNTHMPSSTDDELFDSRRNGFDEETNKSLTWMTNYNLVDMEQKLGTSSATIFQTPISNWAETLPAESPSALQSRENLWPAQDFYDYDFHATAWFTDMITCMHLLAWELGIEVIISTAFGVATFATFFTEARKNGILAAATETILNTNTRLAANWVTWQIYTSMVILFFYTVMCISIERQPERLANLLRFFPRSIYGTIFTTARRIVLLNILTINLPFYLCNLVGLGIAGAILSVFFLHEGCSMLIKKWQFK